MDQVFGPPAMRESKAMEEARNRNRTQERMLNKHISNLTSELRTTTSKILERKNTARELYGIIHPSDPSKNVTCPSGLTDEQKTVYQRLRRTSPPSMSLKEFDNRLEEFRKHSTQSRDASNETTSNRRRRRSTDLTMKQSLSAVIVPKEEGPGYSPLLKRKHRMKEALERIETSDVRIKDENCVKRMSSRRHSTGLPVYSAGSSRDDVDRQQEVIPKVCSPRRRNTVAASLDGESNNSSRKDKPTENEKNTMEEIKEFMKKLSAS